MAIIENIYIICNGTNSIYRKYLPLRLLYERQ